MIEKSTTNQQLVQNRGARKDATGEFPDNRRGNGGGGTHIHTHAARERERERERENQERPGSLTTSTTCQFKIGR
jgi:hypothetical protein